MGYRDNKNLVERMSIKYYYVSAPASTNQMNVEFIDEIYMFRLNSVLIIRV